MVIISLLLITIMLNTKIISIILFSFLAFLSGFCGEGIPLDFSARFYSSPLLSSTQAPLPNVELDCPNPRLRAISTFFGGLRNDAWFL